MNYKNDKKSEDEINVGVGCLPYFLFFLILVSIRFFLAKGKNWESGFVEFLQFFYWVGIGYMVITIIINKANEQGKRSRDEILISSAQINKTSSIKKLELPKVQSVEIKKINVKNKIMSNNNLFNKIGNAKWEMQDLNDIKYPAVEVEFCANGKFIYKNLPCKWNSQNDIIEIHINNGFVILRGQLFNDVLIVGKAKNIRNKEWDIEIKLVELLPVEQLTENALIGTKWKIKHSDKGFDDAYCEFLKNNVLKYREKDNWKWNLSGDKVILMPLSEFSTYTCKIANNKLIGTAIGGSGKKWTLSGEKISNVLFNIRTSSKVSLTRNEPPPLTIEELQKEEELITTNELYVTESNTFESNTELTYNSNFDSSKNNEIVNKFSIESETIIPYKWHALWKYFPKNRFPDDKLESIDLMHRFMVFEFKDGHNPEKFAKIISEALIQKFGKIILKTKTILIVPASNKSKTDTRFKLFCEKVSITTGLINGYHILTNNDKVKIPKRLGGDNEILPYINLNSSINGKDFIIIDDIRTSGTSSNDVNQLLKGNGAKSTIFIYFGRTVSSSNFSNTTNIIDIDDLPF